MPQKKRLRLQRMPRSIEDAVVPQAPRLSTFTHEGESFLVFSSPMVPADIDTLTPSEKQVLADVARGMSNAAIARARQTSTRTVANQVASLFRKTGAGSRAELASFASRCAQTERR